MAVHDDAFRTFAREYSPVAGLTRQVSGEELGARIGKEFGIAVPETLVRFWSEVGVGLFGEGELLFYGEHESGLPGPHLVEWNSGGWRRGLFAPPAKGGPFFFGCSAFGDQIGFRRDRGVDIPVLFSPVESETYRLADDFQALFEEVLAERPALVDPARFREASRGLGQVPVGQCYVCDLSPLLTGKDSGPFHLEPVLVHVVTAVAEHEAISKLPPGTKISRIKVNWD